jgi:hypothetical protein
MISGEGGLMKKHRFAGPEVKILAAGLLISLGAFHGLCACRARGAADSDDYKSRILDATNTLVGPPDPSMTQEKIAGTLAKILDLAVELTPDNQYKPEIKSRIEIAKDLITKSSIFNDKARQYLSFAYRMMTDGKKFEPPKELDVFVTQAELQAKTQKYAKDLVARGVQALEAGRAAETAKLLLELVLMTLTPVRG